MLDNIQSIYYPKNVGKEITFMLYNYNNINELIENRKLELTDNINLSTNAWLKSRRTSGNSLEDVLIKFDKDRYINRLIKWKRTINSFLSSLYDYEDKTLYYLIKMVFFDKFDDEIVKEKFNLDNKELKDNIYKIIGMLYKEAIKQHLYSKEVENKCKMDAELLQLLTKKVELEKLPQH